MRIAEAETFVVGNPPPSFGGQYFVFVKLTTDDGTVGWGEAYAATFRPTVIAAAIEDLADHMLVGEDPHHVERFWRRAYSRGFTQRPDVTLQGCMSALEIACWDIIGKAAGKPVYELLGGRVHDSLRTYTYLYPRDGDDADVYVHRPTEAGRLIETAALSPDQRFAWSVGFDDLLVLSYYLVRPTRVLTDVEVGVLADDELIFVDLERLPDWYPVVTAPDAVTSRDGFAFVRAAALREALDDDPTRR